MTDQDQKKLLMLMDRMIKSSLEAFVNSELRIEGKQIPGATMAQWVEYLQNESQTLNSSIEAQNAEIRRC